MTSPLHPSARDQAPAVPPQQRFSCLPGLLLAYFILAVIAVGCSAQQLPG